MLVKLVSGATVSAIVTMRVSHDSITLVSRGTSPSSVLTCLAPLDRPLQHINKKGRPVSQCQHCRGLRKSRSSHVKCDCGEKQHGKADCAHHEKGDSKRELGDFHYDSVSDKQVEDHSACCCSHGARCTCAHKKDYHLDPVPELGTPTDTPSPISCASPRKPHLATTQSDSHLTVFVNGHHKPAYKHNDAAHTHGMPYNLQRPHSIPGHSHLAHKSMDNIPSTRHYESSHPRLRDSISLAQQDVRLSRSLHGSPHGSPELRPLTNMPVVSYLNSQLPPLDLPYSSWNFGTSPQQGYNSRAGLDYSSYLSTPDDSIAFSANSLSMPPVDWSAMDLPLGNSVSAPYSQPPSYASLDQSNLSRPGLTASSSGDVSEGEEYANFNSPSVADTSAPHFSPAIAEPPSSTADPHRLSTASTLSQPSVLGTFHVEDLNIDNYLKHASASPSSFDEYSGIVPTDTENLTHHGCKVKELQRMAHNGMPSIQVNNAREEEFALSHSGSPLAKEDPAWGPSYDEAGEDRKFEIEAGRNMDRWSS